MTLVEPKPSPRPWFALWRRESGSFAQLPLLARGIFDEVLKLTDDDGVIDIGAREPADAIAWALGADRADRRALAKYVPMLLADGCLVHQGERLIAPSFRRWQPTAKRSRTSNEPTTNEHDAVANEPRTDHERATNAPRSDHETGDKSAEPFTSGPHSKGEESKGEESKSREDQPPSPEAPAPGARIAELEARYPAAVVAEARQGCALARRNGRISDGRWLATLERLDKHPVPVVVAAMRTFAERYADGSKDERYLEGIVRNEARGGGGPRRHRDALAPAAIDPDEAEASLRRAEDLFGPIREAANG